MVKICQTRLLKLNFEIIPKKRIFRFLPKISAGHGWSWKNLFANFQILGPLGCQGWVVIPPNVKKVKITAPYCRYKFAHLFGEQLRDITFYRSKLQLTPLVGNFEDGEIFGLSSINYTYSHALREILLGQLPASFTPHTSAPYHHLFTTE
jgi:hypothetical protein